ncbi:Smr/MutS family protein [Mesorhizobium xinjiangense]|uniref:Smr/MutS family protein n=1 Tax=Mesorhizobium xinjiangense TaxID=2678685 RepID=UPI0012EE50CF|nr:Smr/MutS family protein [Mesorhizobium xinjiangense]
MRSKNTRRLSKEERRLWHEVARTAEPLKGRKLPLSPEDVEAVGESEAAIDRGPARSPAAAPAAGAGMGGPARARSAAPGAIDRTTRAKIAKGRLALEATVDLHGLTQSEAHSLLLAFLSRAYVGGIRQVLVITGKGTSSGGDGVLRKSVPDWLATAAFRQLVTGYSHAARHHGGSGALYVRLRKPRSDT